MAVPAPTSRKLRSITGSDSTEQDSVTAVVEVCYQGSVDPISVLAHSSWPKIGDNYPSFDLINSICHVNSTLLKLQQRDVAFSRIGVPANADPNQPVDINCCDCCYNVTLQWQTLDVQAPPGSLQNPEQPLTWCPELTYRGVARTEAIRNAIFRGIWKLDEAAAGDDKCKPCYEIPVADLLDFSNPCVSRTKGQCGPVVNTAGSPFPLLTREVGDLVIDFCTFHPSSLTFTQALLCNQFTMNCEDFNFVNVCNAAENFTIPKYWARLGAVTITPQSLQRIHPTTGLEVQANYKRLCSSLTIRPGGWQVDLDNKGFTRCGAAGAPDCCGGIISPSDIKPGMSTEATITDIRDNPVNTPVGLGPNGQPSQEQWFARYDRLLCGQKAEWDQLNVGTMAAP